MTSKPRRLDSSTHAEAAAHLTPEEQELERKEAELRALEAELAELELQLATSRGELVAFERRYMHKVGRLYAQLDDLEAQIADAEYHRKPTDDSARRKADSARTRARESAQAVDEAGPDTRDRAFEPSERLGRLYREAARRLHPDLTTDPEEQARRKKAMAAVNRAYEECDEERIRQILDDWRASPEQVEGEDIASQLVRMIRSIALVQKRLSAVRDQIEELRQGELSQLKSQVEEADATGRDLLSEMAGRVNDRIHQAKTKLDSLLNN